jgi:hypothetical protein
MPDCIPPTITITSATGEPLTLDSRDVIVAYERLIAMLCRE